MQQENENFQGRKNFPTENIENPVGFAKQSYRYYISYMAKV